MKIIGVDLHARQQTIAVLDDRTGELVEKELQHEGNEVREFYSTLPPPVLVGIEALCEGVRRNHHGLTDRRHVWWTAPQP
jgi:hypothetical protein